MLRRMPRYFFHIRTTPGLVIPDMTGIDFADIAAAVADAERGVVERHPGDFQAILITDEAGELLATVPFDLTRPSRRT
jgi:hypothetical protein